MGRRAISSRPSWAGGGLLRRLSGLLGSRPLSNFTPDRLGWAGLGGDRGGNGAESSRF
jgi:hypothetical protein